MCSEEEMEKGKLNQFIKEGTTLYYLANKEALIPYIENGLKNKIFENQKMAQEYINDQAKEHGENLRHIIYFSPIKFTEEKWQKYVSKVYSAGGKYIECIYNDKRTSIREIKKENVPSCYYNQELARNIAEYTETKSKACLKRIRNLKFIIPCKIKPTKTTTGKDTLMFVYAQAVLTKAKETYYFVFTDMLEYQKWERANTRETSEGWEWKPLLLSSQDIARISKNHGILINACSWQLILKPEECRLFCEDDVSDKTPAVNMVKEQEESENDDVE